MSKAKKAVGAAAAGGASPMADDSKGTKKAAGKLPADLEDIRANVHIGAAAPAHTRASNDAFEGLGIDNTFDLTTFVQNMRITIQSCTPEAMVFDLSGVDAPIANALRRILLSEVPTMAIDKVLLFQNTSVIQDEVLAHRLGLIPIKVDPRRFKYVHESKDNEPNEENTTVFTLDVTCQRAKKDSAATPASERFVNATVLSSQLQWVPQGEQGKTFAGAAAIRPVHPDIVIAKLRPGQQIECELHVVKGIGKTHAKWSPVATASYRLLPQVVITTPFTGADADELVAKCPQKVFDIEDLGKAAGAAAGAAGGRRAKVARPRDCSMCRECIRPAGWEEKIQLRRKRDHFIFSIESTGAYTAADLFKEAIKVLVSKCQALLSELRRAPEPAAAGAGADGAAAAADDAAAAADGEDVAMN